MPKCTCASAKVGPDASPWCNCREAIHTFSARASVYALGSDMKIDGGTFPNSSVGDCFLLPPLHNFLPSHSAAPASSVNMHAGFLISPPLRYPPSSTPLRHTPKTLVVQDRHYVGYWGTSGRREKKLILRLKMFSQFKMEDWKLLCNRQVEFQQFLVSISTEFLAYKFWNENPITLSENQLKLRL